MTAAPASTGRAFRIVRNPHFWLVVAMLAIGALFHYGTHIYLVGILSGELPLGLTRHSMHRVLFLLPITYAGFVFGPVIGLLTLSAAALVMLPRAIFLSPKPADALFETVAVLGVGVLVILWFESLEKEKARRAQAIARLEAAQEELQSHLQIIKEDKKRLNALNTISAFLAEHLELEPILDGALQKVLETLNLEAEGGIFLLDAENQGLVLSVHQGLSPEFVRQEARVALGECLCGRAAQSGELLFAPDCLSDVRHTRRSKASSHSHIIVPLKSKDRVLGIMFLYPQASYHPPLEDAQFLTAIGHQIGVAIENASLYRKQREALEQLRLSEKNYRELFETANDAIWVQDMEGQIAGANKAASRLTGYSWEELIGMNVRDFLSSEGLEVARIVGEKLLRGEVLEPYEQKLTKKDGTVAVMKLATSLITRNGERRGFQHIA